MLWKNDLVIFIPKNNTSRSLDMHICLQLNDISCKLKEDMAPTKQLSIETMEMIVKFIQEGNPRWIFGLAWFGLMAI